MYACVTLRVLSVLKIVHILYYFVGLQSKEMKRSITKHPYTEHSLVFIYTYIINSETGRGHKHVPSL